MKFEEYEKLKISAEQDLEKIFSKSVYELIPSNEKFFGSLKRKIMLMGVKI